MVPDSDCLCWIWIGNHCGNINHVCWTSSLELKVFQEAFKFWEDSPVMTQVESISYSLWNVPFPTITVCTNQKKKKFDNWRLVQTGLDMIELACILQR